MKVFNGGKFLEEKAVSVTFSNGKTAVVSEVSDEALALMDANAEKKGTEPLRELLACMCKFEVSELANVGLVELKGTLDFLSESLFAAQK